MLLVCPSFSGRTYRMLKILSRKPHRSIYLFTKSLLEQCSKSKMKTKEIGEKIKPLSEYKNAIIVFDDILGTSTSKIKGQFFIRGSHNNFDNFICRNSILIYQKDVYEMIVIS